MNDDYMGSGKLVKLAIEKYGIENFTREYIEVFDNPEEMFAMEAAIVNKEFVSDTNTYNLKVGGSGGFDHIDRTGISHSEETKEKIRDARKQQVITDETREKMKENHWSKKDKDAHSIHMRDINLGKSKSEEHKMKIKNSMTDEIRQRIGEATRKRQQGAGNPQLGTMWIYNLDLKESKKIKKEDFPNWEQDGWLKGRKMKFN